MTRGFTKESDQSPPELLPERPISQFPNFVTPNGMIEIEAQLRRLEAAHAAAHAAGDHQTIAQIMRDMRYWSQRKSSARVIPPAVDPDTVRFGRLVTIRFDDGSEQRFRLVGEDEADPARGLLDWTSPLGRALIGTQVSDEIKVLDRLGEVVAIDA